MMKYFNIAGPCNKQDHYMIEASTRLQGVEQLIDREQYFVIHAARQSGKTTYLQDLSQRLNAEGTYHVLYCSLESAQGMADSKEGIPAIIRSIKSYIKYSTLPHTTEFAWDADYGDYNNVLRTTLIDFCKLLDKPLVIFFDETDCLVENTLILFLRQLRSGYNDRSITPFVHSIALVGMRNIRDYKAKIRPDSQSLGSASPFNIVTKSLTLQNFTETEIIQLYHQHTDVAGQIFKDDAIGLVYEQTQGQPWLVNAIAREVIVEILQSDYTQPITSALVNEAIQNIILNRPTHIDSLLERLNEERVRKIIEPMILGESFINQESDDFLYTKDLGLIRVDHAQIRPSNPIYSEVIVRKLSSITQCELQQSEYPYQIPRYLTPDGRIDMDFLMRDFQQFWRENSQIWINRYDYKEAAPHLILMAFLQRVVNGGGQIIREMAAGSGRLDLCLVYEGRKYPIEIKIRYGEKYLEKGLEQTSRYMDIYGCSEGWLAIFDRRVRVKWEDKIFMKKETINGKTITIVGL
jgi:type II secretory pathway predicted ATPase ExeA